jgi:hypothetical protein
MSETSGGRTVIRTMQATQGRAYELCHYINSGGPLRTTTSASASFWAEIDARADYRPPNPPPDMGVLARI